MSSFYMSNTRGLISLRAPAEASPERPPGIRHVHKQRPSSLVFELFHPFIGLIIQRMREKSQNRVRRPTQGSHLLGILCGIVNRFFLRSATYSMLTPRERVNGTINHLP